MSVIGSNILAGSSGQGGAGYEIERSLKFNSGDSPYLNRVFGTATSTTTFSISMWVKRVEFSQATYLFVAGTGTQGYFVFDADIIRFYGVNGDLKTNAKYRDPSAWYHIVGVADTSNATADDRMRLYVNGVQLTNANGDFSTHTQPSQGASLGDWNSAATHYVNRLSAGNYQNFYLADFQFIDGQALSATDFGKYDSNVWQPKKYAGTYGTNGFHLDFSDTSSSAALGTDASSNGNTWTVNNLTVTNGINYVNAVTAAVSGSVPNGGTPYWVDIIPTNADLGYTTGNDLDKAFDGNTTTNVYWVGDQYANGNVTRARFDLRDFPTITSLRVYSGGIGASYISYNYQLLDNSKSAIAGTSGTFGTAQTWHTIPLAGTPRYLEFSCTSGGNRRNRLNAIEVNGTILVNSTATIAALRDSPVNGDSANDTGAGGEITGNYATLNPLHNNAATGGNGAILSDGNLKTTFTTSSSTGTVPATIFVSSGKWYCEFTAENISSSTEPQFGIVRPDDAIDGYIGKTGTNGVSYEPFQDRRYNAGTSTTPMFGQTTTSGTHTYGLALDLDDGTLDVYEDGTLLGELVSGLSGTWTFAAADIGGADVPTIIANFGQSPFAYTAPSGYKCLCTANLINTTVITSGTYTGNSAASGPFVYLNGVPTAMSIGGSAVTFGTDIDKLSNGFKIRSATSNNTAGTPYSYSVTTTGDPFKTARAQTN